MSEGRETEEARTRAFAARIAGALEPPPLAPSERVAFTEVLEARIVQRRRRRRGLSAATALVATGALVWALLPGAAPTPAPQTAPPALAGATPEPAVPTTVARVDADAASDWDFEVLHGGEWQDEEATGDDGLPDDYTVLAGMFLDG